MCSRRTSGEVLSNVQLCGAVVWPRFSALPPTRILPHLLTWLTWLTCSPVTVLLSAPTVYQWVCACPCGRYPDCPKAEGVKYIFVVRGEQLRGAKIWCTAQRRRRVLPRKVGSSC